MKIRIKGNSIRIRITKPEVSELVNSGSISSSLAFAGGNTFRYSVISANDIAGKLQASYEDNHIKLLVNKNIIHEWDDNEIVGFEDIFRNSDGSETSLLLEKDFKCLIPRDEEDESEHYENPEAE